MPRSFTVASPDLDPFLEHPIPRCLCRHRAESLDQLHSVLRHSSPGTTPLTLDLLGHGTTGHRLLRLGDTPIDMLNPRVADFFATLAHSGLLPRRGIIAVRLLGCQTATTDAGRRTLRLLAHTLRLPVFGTLVPLLNGHYTAHGFNPAFTHQLVQAHPDPSQNPPILHPAPPATLSP